MRKLLLWLLFFLLPFLYSVYVCAQPGKQKDCSTTCFSSEVISVEKLSDECARYELKVSYSGDCAHALSHFTVAVPCGAIENIWNSGHWAQEVGTDPTTGLRGFKIDNTANFGEGPLNAFTVKFTICATDETCAADMSCWQPVVAYKAATCVNYETVAVNCQILDGSLEKTDVTCFGAADGSLSVIVTEGREPYTFLWSDNVTAASRTGLPAGTYSVTVRDASGAELTLEETIHEPELMTVEGTASPASCNGMTDGSIDITVSGGVAPYTFVWNNGATTEDADGLASGQHTVVVTDATGCSTTAQFSVGAASAIDISATVVKPDCGGSNGSIDITAAGGTVPYTFSWSNGATTEDLDQIAPGLYTVTVTDDAGCSQKGIYFVKENNTLAVKGTVTAANCTEATGAIDINVTGGTAPYTYTWSNGETSEDLSGLSSGSYTVTITDDKSCTASATYGIPKTTFQVPRTVVQPSCQGDTDGSITLGEPTGGTAPYTYEWSNGETGTSISNLGAGTYSVTVTDVTGCSRTLTSMLTEPTAIVVEATVSSTACGEDGSFVIDISATGGTAPYSYEWSDGSIDRDRENMSNGAYTVTVTDARGCTATKEVIVEGELSTWSCLITELAAAPECGSAGNTLSTSVTDADAYSWTVESSDGMWSLNDSNSSSVTFTAGGENSTATFRLTITRDGCTKTCSYVVTSCTPKDGGVTDPGNEEPGGEEPGGEEPGGEEPANGEGGNQTCEECFSTTARLIGEEDGCRIYEMKVSTNGLCRHELSHWTLAVPCGVVSHYWNSEGWPMEFGKDPTTGLYGLKVDNINSFGKEEGFFTVRFTVCGGTNCDLADWAPVAAYKAGQCVGIASVEIDHSLAEAAVSAYPNPFSETIQFEWKGTDDNVDLLIIDQYGNTVSRHTTAAGRADDYYITVESSSLPHGMYYYRLTVDGRTFNGKISKR